MAKKLLVRTPKTSDGLTPKIGADGRIEYKETIVEATAKQYFESLNSTMKEHLRHELQLVDVDAKGKIVKPEKAKEDANKK